MPCVLVQGVPGLLRHFHQTSLCVCGETGLREYIAEEWTVSLKTVQFSSGSSECVPLHLNGCRYHWLMLFSYCFVSVWRHPVSLALSCLVGRRAGWMHMLSLLTTSRLSVQQSAPKLSLCHSFALWYMIKLKWQAILLSSKLTFNTKQATRKLLKHFSDLTC